MKVVAISNLTKNYGTFSAVSNLSLSIEAGNVYGFLGLNGAGKTTTMRMLLGMIRPTAGTVRLFDNRADKTEWSKVGYMIESTRAYPDLSVEEYLNVFYRYYGLKSKTAISRVLSLLNLEQYKRKKAKHLSLGNLQRLGLAKALIHQPELLVLDEPVNGLDPAGIVEVRHLIRHLGDQGVTVLISSHLLGEIAKTADTIGIIHEGVLISEFDSAKLHQSLNRKLIVDTKDNMAASTLLANSGLHATLNDRNELELSNEEVVGKPESVVELLTSHQLTPRKVLLHEEDLESYFLRIITKK